ncbi:hypothetical protein [Nitratireductor alexandrii]|uniref:hypothetical protein n=1 Tax=Nitratireductor alexandrii TaxID=2448161 RepID=UPI000FD6D287|nr:hypothetical protein [Nitratireductor alexandrii]
MAEFLTGYLPLLRGIGIGAVIAFIVDDLLSPRSWVLSTWKEWRGHRATFEFRFNARDDRAFDYEVKVKLGRNSGRVFLTGRAARLRHYMDGTTKWKWETPPITLWETARGAKGEEVERQVFLRKPDDAHKVRVFDRDISIKDVELILVEVTINVGGRVERRKKVFEVFVPERIITRAIEPSWLPFTPSEPS